MTKKKPKYIYRINYDCKHVERHEYDSDLDGPFGLPDNVHLSETEAYAELADYIEKENREEAMRFIAKCVAEETIANFLSGGTGKLLRDDNYSDFDHLMDKLESNGFKRKKRNY